MAESRRKSSSQRATGKQVRVLFSCIGRRVELLEAFRQAGRKLGITLELHGADSSPLAPAMQLVDKKHQVAPISTGRYLDDLLRVVRRFKIDLLIPLIDTELPLLAAGAQRFADVGCRALISSEAVVTVCRDKLLTYQALKCARIDTPATWLWDQAVRKERHRFPLFLKPRTGSAAAGNYVIRDFDELETLGRRVDRPIVQEFVEGCEHTLDVYTGFDGFPKCVVPRRRLEVRTGEVSKGLIVKDPAVMEVGRRVVEALGSCRGVVTVQCMVTPRGRIRVIEINPRFGGGAPLAIYAGADFPKWLLMELLGRRPRIGFDAFRDDIAMLRYDQSVFVRKASRLLSDRPKTT